MLTDSHRAKEEIRRLRTEVKACQSRCAQMVDAFLRDARRQHGNCAGDPFETCMEPNCIRARQLVLNNPGQPLLDELHALQVECKELKRELARKELKRCEPK